MKEAVHHDNSQIQRELPNLGFQIGNFYEVINHLFHGRPQIICQFWNWTEQLLTIGFDFDRERVRSSEKSVFFVKRAYNFYKFLLNQWYIDTVLNNMPNTRHMKSLKKLEELATKKDIESLTNLVNSLHDHIDLQNKEISSLQERVDSQKIKISQLEDRVEFCLLACLKPWNKQMTTSNIQEGTA